METIQPRVVQHRWASVAGAAYFLTTDMVKLFKNDVPVVPGMVLADLTEADFVGYAPIILADSWLAGVSQLNEMLQVQPVLSQFTAGALAGDQIVYGYYLVDTTELILKGVVRFDTPFTFTTLGQKLLVKELNFGLIRMNNHSEFIDV